MTAGYEPLRALLTGAGYDFVEPAIVHRAGVFVDLAGEDLRRRLYLTNDGDGVELALRPDYTIPVCLRHIGLGDHRRRADYAYLGPVFRQRGGAPGEFLQAGVEALGRNDRLAADAEILGLAIDAAGCLGVSRPSVRIGDSALFESLVRALDISAPWRRRLSRTFGDPERLAELIDKARTGVLFPRLNRPAGLEGAGRAKLRRVAEEMLFAQGLATLGGRQADEIARRFMQKDALGRGIGDRAASILEAYLSIRAKPEAALGHMRALAKRRKIAFGPAIDRFEKRIAAIAAKGIPLHDLTFAADFGRRLDYYTGFVFEIHRTGGASQPIVGGGRYDRLMSMLGADGMIPAVGFAIWLERTGVDR